MNFYFVSPDLVGIINLYKKSICDDLSMTGRKLLIQHRI